jgi:hypothetical protein
VSHYYYFHCNILFYYCIIFVLGVHCDIYNSSYNVSWLNSCPPSFFFIPSSPIPGSFNRSHFPIFIHKYLIFHYIHPSYTLSLLSSL